MANTGKIDFRDFKSGVTLLEKRSWLIASMEEGKPCTRRFLSSLS
jgi:hypothetical protein